MKPFEIGMVVGQHSTLLGNGIREDFGIANTLACATRVLNRAHVVPEAAQLLNNRQRKIFVRIESGHEWSVCLVDTNVVVDLRDVSSLPSGRSLAEGQKTVAVEVERLELVDRAGKLIKAHLLVAILVHLDKPIRAGRRGGVGRHHDRRR